MTVKPEATQLKGVRIASPCTADWEAMEGDDKVRYCGACRLNVYNLSAMDVEEAAERIMQDDPVCIRFYRRADGTILTRDCPVGAATAERRTRRAMAVGSPAFALTLVASVSVGGTALFPVREQGARANPAAVRRQVLRNAAATGDLRLMRKALDAGASPNSKGPGGRTPLMLAAEAGSSDGARLLLLSGAMANARDRSGKTALRYARDAAEDEAAAVLLAWGATE